MLLPKFTIRQLLLGMVGAAAICSVLGLAARGSVLAHGMGLAMLGLVVPFGLFAIVYWTVLLMSKILPGAHTPDAWIENARQSGPARHSHPQPESAKNQNELEKNESESGERQ